MWSAKYCRTQILSLDLLSKAQGPHGRANLVVRRCFSRNGGSADRRLSYIWNSKISGVERRLFAFGSPATANCLESRFCDHHLRRSRLFSSSKSQTKDETPETVVSTNSGAPASEKVAARDIPDDSDDGDATSGAITNNKNDTIRPASSEGMSVPLSVTPRAKMTRAERNWILQKDIELYQEIVRTRARLKEETRVKMASNVYRALCGNVAICGAKLAAWASSGSSALLAEFVHSVVDCGNQALLLVGLRESQMSADRRHPYGYGKSIYFWALVSALGTFFLGAGVSMTHAVGALMEPSLTEITPEVWGVLLFSLSVDGYVLIKTVAETREGQPAGVSYWKHLKNIRDPAIMAVLLEDGAACLGVVMALGGIVASHVTGNPIFDGVAGVGISTLLGAMGIALTRMNYRFLLGQSVDKEITDDIEQILLKRKSIDRVKSIQSQWTGPDSFSFKAEVDFDGTYLAAMLMPIYQNEFLEIRDSMDSELRVLLALYAEDVMRAVEREIRHVEAQIRLKHPGAEFIELEPMSLDVDRLAIDDNLESDLKRVEMESLDRYLKSLKKDARDLEQANNQSNPPRNP